MGAWQKWAARLCGSLARGARYKEYIKEVLYYLAKAGLRLKLEKCEFYKEEVAFLDFIIEVNRVYISDKKIK